MKLNLALAFTLLWASTALGEWPPDAPDPPPQLDPRLITSLPPKEDQGLDMVPPGLHILAEAAYSFGTAVAPSGDVYFTEFNERRIRRYNPSDHSVTTVVANRPGLYGIATDGEGNIFYAQDSDLGTGRIVKRSPDGTEQEIVSGLTRPRQLTTDAAGNLYAVLETRSIIKWVKNTGNIQFLVTSPQIPTSGPPQGVAVADDGRLFFSTYSETGAYGVMFEPGAVWQRATNGTITKVVDGFWRARGLALHPSGKLYLATESNVWDQGNAGLLVEIDPDLKTATRVLEGTDYPQFPAIGPDGRIYNTTARDFKLVAFDPAHNFVNQAIAEPNLTLIAENATWQETAGGGALPIGIDIDTVSVDGFLDMQPAAADASLWINLPASALNLSLERLPDTNFIPGIFELPVVTVDWAHGTATAFAVALREHERARWPMTTVVGSPEPAPQPDFGESPEAYLIYVNVAAATNTAANTWTGSGDWNIAANWNSGIVPSGSSGQAEIHPLSISGAAGFPVVTSSGNLVQNLLLGDNNEGIGLLIDGGSLHATAAINLGLNYDATVNISGGSLTSDSDINLSTINGGADGTINISGGLLQTDAQLLLGWEENAGTLNISGGTVQVDGILIFNLDGANPGAQEARVNLSGGTLSVGGLSINTLDPARLDITGGEFILPMSYQNELNFWINSRHITAFDGQRGLKIDQLPGDRLLVTAIFSPDLDFDGDIDADDLSLLQSSWGVDAGGDADGDGDTDGADLLAWQRQYTGALGTNSTAVPEPSTSALIGLAITTLILRRSR